LKHLKFNLKVFLQGGELIRIEQFDFLIPSRHAMSGRKRRENKRRRRGMRPRIESIGIAEGRGVILRETEGVLAIKVLIFKLGHY
jgi:hypothetical protein